MASFGKAIAETETLKQGGVVEDAEDFIFDLLNRIQPTPASESRRKNVARYVQDTIARAFVPAYEVKTFGYLKFTCPVISKEEINIRFKLS